ncbi:acetyl-CoA C-acetyltransferase [Cryptococcus gattii E566]|uniref:acetyl-CoA C-acetyltransferase n=1 Tax=Cryptococcus gattii EJB2 TaxID=1296103 RepID=A0ABR5C1J1_9TREE|nr:acetyl-CoA C-acetyltransferase [Cryptococcus gattii EJB2]KIY36652.1 acetyl-CoA C-acetyltransferase [Cryptococcus gattii E566]
MRTSLRLLSQNIKQARIMVNPVYIVSASRTPVGAKDGSLATVSAPQLGVVAVKHAVEKAGIKPEQVEELYMGNVVQAGVGQSPARQVGIGAGIPETTDATTINKVCASGMKAIMLATQNIQLGQRGIMVAGGMESMSQAPFLVPRQNPAFGGFETKDSLVVDGLFDVYNKVPMGNCAEHTAAKLKITREDQDDFCLSSYTRAQEAWAADAFADEIAPVTVKGRKGDVVVKEDEDYKKLLKDKFRTIRPVFVKENGTVTAANASTLNDGASAVVLASGEVVEKEGLKPLAKILGFADAACAPIDFPTAPTLAVPLALKNAGVSKDEIALWEFNEAFSVVGVAAERVLGLDRSKVNVKGGAVALGHPIGSSGCRIVVTLVHALKKGEKGVAAICNGGGAASAIVVERL